MDKKSIFDRLSPRHAKLLEQFCMSYRKIEGTSESVISRFLDFIQRQVDHPFRFQPYHEKIRRPLDYYQFGLDFIRPLINFSSSTVSGIETLHQIDEQLQKGENVVLLANHQTETDPQIISILLEKSHARIAEQIIYVAGERVITDPLAIPFSMGCNLLCIYSKRYINSPPELKNEKQLHNKSTMELMSRLLKEGGKIIYVAPSGGRDRRSSSGKVEVASFDPQSIEMFSLMARKAKVPTHFYPLALSTYELLPPPNTIQVELGEERVIQHAPAHLAFLPEFDMEKFPGSDENDKILRRQNRAAEIWKLVKEHHDRMI
jgi:glycerol-3-phosphate O-acyltransferase